MTGIGQGFLLPKGKFLLERDELEGESVVLENKKQIIFATWLGIIVNLFLTILKGVAGVLTGSKALLADAAHSASDIVGSIVILFGIRIAMKPADREHPYGHGKAESVATIIVALLLIVVGVEVAISSIKVFSGEPPSVPGKLALVVIIISVIIKELLFQYKYYLGRKFKSSALISEAWHHRSDALSSVAALLGVGLAIAGKSLNMPILVYADAVAGVIVSVIVIKIGYSLARESSRVMMEQVLIGEDVKKYKDTVNEVSEVIGIDGIRARTHGHYILIDIIIIVEATLTVEEGHEITKKVKKHLIEQHPEVQDVLVHINPN